MPLIPEHGRLRQKDHELKLQESLDYAARPCLKKKKKMRMGFISYFLSLGIGGLGILTFSCPAALRPPASGPPFLLRSKC
jgi:hypothetical protein